ncbi:MAG: dipeptidase [Candidatus Bruticola sp.]
MLCFFDGHNDSFVKCYPPRHLRNGASPLQAHAFVNGTTNTHIDLPRALKAGYLGALCAVFIDPPLGDDSTCLQAHSREVPEGRHPNLEIPIDHQLALKATLEVMSRIFQDERISDGFKITRSYKDLTDTISQHKLAVVIHLEGCEAIDVNLDSLEVLYQAGVRSLGICWSRPNIFGTGVPFAYKVPPDTGPGLTGAGLSLVKRCNELGILLDAAHLNAQGFYDLAAASRGPLVVSHSSAFTLCPASRALTDHQLQTVAEHRGLVGVTFHVPDLIGPRAQESPYIPQAAELYSNFKEVKKSLQSRQLQPRSCSELEAIIAHIVYIGKQIGFDHVAIGSDFDGCLIPDQIKDVSDIHLIYEGLRAAGLNEKELDKVLYKNWLRVIQESWEVNKN